MTGPNPKETRPSPGPQDKERLFPVPPGYDPAVLAEDLAQWLETEQGWEAEVQVVEEGWLIQVRDPGGRFEKLVSGRPENIRVTVNPSGKGILVKLDFGNEAEIKDQDREKGFSLWNLPSRAWDAAMDMAEAARSGVSGLWGDKAPGEAVFSFIDRHISECRPVRATDIDPMMSRYVEEMSQTESEWLADFLGQEEILLAWLRTSTPASEEEKGEWRFFLTSVRAGLVAFGKKRKTFVRELPTLPLTVSDSIGRDEVSVGEVTWRTQFGNDGLFSEIAALTGLKALERLNEAARLNFLNREKSKKQVSLAQSILDYLSTRSKDPLILPGRILVSVTAQRDEDATTHFDRTTVGQALKADGDPEVMAEEFSRIPSSQALSHWAEAWALSPWEKISLAGFIQNLRPDSSELARLVHGLLTDSREIFVKKERNLILQVLGDVIFAQNLGRLGRKEQGTEILENRLLKLPDETLSDLLPPPNLDLTKGEGGQLMRVNILELLAELRGTDDRPDEKTLRELAVLQPLVPERLSALGRMGTPKILEQVSVPLDLLKPGGSRGEKAPGPALTTGGITPLGQQDLENRLRHPAGREGSILRRMQSLLAARKIPDHSALKLYAKHITPDSEGAVSSAMADGSLMLGLDGLEGYIAYGEMNTGIRGFEGKPPFLLIGGEHLNPGSPFFMDRQELRFAVGKELAHIKFKHERISSRDVWEGAFDKAFSLVGLVPVVGGYLDKIGQLGKLAGQTSKVTKTIGNIHGYLKQARDLADSVQDYFLDGKKSKSSPKLKNKELDLIEAFRVMQLTADRAGLLLCADLNAAVRAMFKSSPSLSPDELKEAEEIGLERFLKRTDENGNLMFQSLAIRLASLFSFYLSEDYEELHTLIRSK